MSNDKTGAYAAAELGSKLRGKDPGEPVRSYAGLIDDRRTLQILNYYDGLVDEPIEETRIGQLIISNAATEMIDEAVRHGSVSQMKSATGLTSNDHDGGSILTKAADELRHEGSIGLVFGSPGSGKTATTIDIAMTWRARTGGTLIGNTSWSGFDRVVRSDQEMVEAMASVEGPVLAVLDEIAQELSGFGTGNKAAEQFSNSLLFIRKEEDQHGPHPKRGSALLVGHTRTKTAKSLRRVASFAIEKPRRSDPGFARLLETEGGKDSWEEGGDYKGLTDTAENYAEHEASEFDIILDDDEDDEMDAESADDIKRDEAIRQAIRAVVRHEMTYADAADVVGYSAAWVSDRMAEYRKGEHDDLLNEATA